jgi:outer membrane protein TolC
MYRELLAVDLPTVARVAVARGIDTREARERVHAAEGRYESSVEAIFPVIAPTFAYQHLEGVNQAATGTLVSTNFNNLLPAITLQWVLNPGRVYYDIVASRRRLDASREQERAAELDTLRAAAEQYYDLVLAQAKVGVAGQSAAQAEESLRLTARRVRAGTALAGDESRARASLAGRRQDLLLAVNRFYQASIALTVTLHLDPVITLVPGRQEVTQTTLVREELPVGEALGIAVRHRPDLQSARTLLAATNADKGAVAWGALGPQLQAAYTFGGLQTRVGGQTFGMDQQERASASVGFALGASTFGQLKIAAANVRIAVLDVERRLEQIGAQVVSAQQASATSAALIPIAREQVQAAEETLRLAQANLNAGTVLLLDVLLAEDEVDNARLRYAQSVVQYNQSQVRLLAAIGLLDAGALTPTKTQSTTTQPAAPQPATQ